MIDAIKRYFEKHLGPIEDTVRERDEHALRLATAALLFTMTGVDYKVQALEREAVARAVQSKFGLSDVETTELLRLAEEAAAAAVSDYEFTSLINRGFSPEQKVKVIEHLWRVAFADRELNMHEEHLVRRIAELLYVPHTAFIAAKHRVQQEVSARGGSA
jgi:uncharacterized tellurite resistance protein B-like protein